MAALLLRPRPLTAAAFAPFGQVIETEGHEPRLINQGSTERFHGLAEIDFDPAGGGRAFLSIFRATPLVQPILIRMMERHPLGSQAFVPLEPVPFLVLVAPKGEGIAPQALQLFLSNGRQGVNYGRNTWHHPVLALHRRTDFLVADRVGAGNNCEEFFFESEIRLDLE